MKVLLVNGSPHEKGCTYTALREAADSLIAEGIEAELFWIGTKPLSGCIACRACAEKKRCVFDDSVNEFLRISGSFDGFIFGSPVHWGGASGALTSFMDRAFYADSTSGNNTLLFKPAAAVMSARRAGTTATWDQINKYFALKQMPIISSRYWPMVHGNTPEEVKKDLEGMQIMRILGRNMAYFLKCLDAGQKAGITRPAQEAVTMTNFIRE